MGVADAKRAHNALLHALRNLESAEQTAVCRFADVFHGRLYRVLGYSTIHHYAREALHFPPARISQFLRLAEDMRRLPMVAKALEQNDITWTKAREIGKVATPDTQDVWVERAKKVPRTQLEKDIRRARAKRPRQQIPMLPAPDPPPGDPPVRVTLELTPAQAAKVQKLQEALRPGRNRSQLYVEALEALVQAESKPAPRNGSRPAAQIVAYRCESCSGVDVPAAGSLRRLDPVDAEVLACDGDQVDRKGRKRSSVPPRLRRQVLARDRHRCVRCGRSGPLHLHHRKPIASGGRHSLENLVTVCAPCHRHHHARGISPPAVNAANEPEEDPPGPPGSPRESPR